MTTRHNIALALSRELISQLRELLKVGVMRSKEGHQMLTWVFNWPEQQLQLLISNPDAHRMLFIDLAGVTPIDIDKFSTCFDLMQTILNSETTNELGIDIIKHADQITVHFATNSTNKLRHSHAMSVPAKHEALLQLPQPQENQLNHTELDSILTICKRQPPYDYIRLLPNERVIEFYRGSMVNSVYCEAVGALATEVTLPYDSLTVLQDALDNGNEIVGITQMNDQLRISHANGYTQKIFNVSNADNAKTVTEELARIPIRTQSLSSEKKRYQTTLDVKSIPYANLLIHQNQLMLFVDSEHHHMTKWLEVIPHCESPPETAPTSQLYLVPMSQLLALKLGNVTDDCIATLQVNRLSDESIGLVICLQGKHLNACVTLPLIPNPEQLPEAIARYENAQAQGNGQLGGQTSLFDMTSSPYS
ncbi:hypothetical protein [Ferrimonas senticii]|uniref:hypothetical protein n=1 Tax=Ferrimonas senticii TaxID=394566 RepID=UPI0004127242|nr:hypothetical protein [Ferrimonas senticii]